jgi:hypothetical protein
MQHLRAAALLGRFLPNDLGRSFVERLFFCLRVAAYEAQSPPASGIPRRGRNFVRRRLRARRRPWGAAPSGIPRKQRASSAGSFWFEVIDLNGGRTPKFQALTPSESITEVARSVALGKGSRLHLFGPEDDKDRQERRKEG